MTPSGRAAAGPPQPRRRGTAPGGEAVVRESGRRDDGTDDAAAACGGATARAAPPGWPGRSRRPRNTAPAVRWAALPYVGDQPRVHHGDALSPAALPGAGQQRAGQQVTSKDRPAGASKAAPIPCTTREALSRPGPTARPPEMLAATNTTKPIRYSSATLTIVKSSTTMSAGLVPAGLCRLRVSPGHSGPAARAPSCLT